MSRQGYFAKNKRQKDGRFPTKIVVRRLPPNFTWEIFKQQVSPIPPYDYHYFVTADKVDGANSFSRAYIEFIHYEDVFAFKEKYDTYVFLGPKGMGYSAVVEFAPFQKIPKDRFFERRDAKCGTIQNNAYYLQFVHTMSLPRCESVERPEYDLQLNAQLEQTQAITPLLRYLSAKKLDQIRNRPERRREAKCLLRSENCMVFVNSSVKKNVNHYVYMKRHSQ